MFANEFVILQVRIGGTYAIDLFGLAGREIFAGIQTPSALAAILAAARFREFPGCSRESACDGSNNAAFASVDLLGERQ